MIPRVDGAAAGDIGRQRHVAALGQRLVQHRAVEGERERDLAALAFGFDRGVELAEEAHFALVAEPHHVADREPLGRLHQSLPARAVESFRQRRRDRRLMVAAADAAAREARRDHLGIVDDHRVARPQQRRQIAHDAVFQHRLALRAHDQKPRGVARHGRPQRDAVVRQRKVEQLGSHRSGS